MRYIITVIDYQEGYIVTDIPAIADVIKISKYTIANWFRNNRTYHKTSNYIIVKNPTIIKSNRTPSKFK